MPDSNTLSENHTGPIATGQRFAQPDANLGNTQKTKTLQIVLNLLGALLIAGTYAYTVLTAGAGAEDISHASLPLTTGYLVGVMMLLLGNISHIPLSVVALIPFAAAFNIVLGQLVGFSGIPLYLDSIATILVGYLAGPAAGVLTGIMTNLAWGLTINPSTIPFSAGAACVGLLAGLAGKYGLFEKLWTVILAGAITGIVAGLLGAPIAAFVFGGGMGIGTGGVVAALQAAGNSILEATTLQSLLSDPLDKTIAFVMVWLIALSIPHRLKDQFRKP